MFYAVIAGIKNVEGLFRPDTGYRSYSIPPPKSVVDPDSLNSDLDMDSDPVFQENLDSCDGFFAFNVGTFGYFMEGNSVTPLNGHETI
jgi:hypothetical protein